MRKILIPLMVMALILSVGSTLTIGQEEVQTPPQKMEFGVGIESKSIDGYNLGGPTSSLTFGGKAIRFFLGNWSKENRIETPFFDWEYIRGLTLIEGSYYPVVAKPIPFLVNTIEGIELKEEWLVGIKKGTINILELFRESGLRFGVGGSLLIGYEKRKASINIPFLPPFKWKEGTSHWTLLGTGGSELVVPFKLLGTKMDCFVGHNFNLRPWPLRLYGSSHIGIEVLF